MQAIPITDTAESGQTQVRWAGMGAWWERRRDPRGPGQRKTKRWGSLLGPLSQAHPPPPLPLPPPHCPQASSPAEVFSSSAGMVVTSGVWAPWSGWR